MSALGRPPLPIGAYGNITTRQIGPDKWEARAYFKGADGKLQRPKRVGSTKNKAENALKEALTKMAQEVFSNQVTPGTKFEVVAEQWFAELELAVRLGTASSNTARQYRGYLDNHILPDLGRLRCQPDVNVTAIFNLRKKKLAAGMKADAWAQVQKVVSGVCGFAVVAKALGSNPVKELPKLTRGEGKRKKKKVLALTRDQRIELFDKLRADKTAMRHQVPDIVESMLAAGVRIAELIACSGDDLIRIDGKPFLRVDHRVVWEKGKGTRRKEREDTTKGDGQFLELPLWVWPILSPRKLAAGPEGPLFPAARSGSWMNPTLAVGNVTAAMKRAGYAWVTSHVMRKTHGTVLAEAGLSLRQIARRLGHKKEATSEQYYIAEVTQDPAVIEALEDMVESG